MLAGVLKLLNSHPEARLITVSQNDNENYCKCANCTKVALEEGVDGEARQSGPIIRFVNRIAHAVKEAGFTEVKIHTFAYQYSVLPPSVTKCEDNVLVQLCSIKNCSLHALNDPACNEYGGPWNEYYNNVVWADALVNWSKICDTLHIWDYTTDFYFHSILYPNFHVLRENMRFFAENNVKGVLEEGHYSTNQANLEFGALRAYVLGKLAWDPYMTEEEYQTCIDDFLKGYYGAGWEEIREYFDFAMASGVKRDMHFECFGHLMKLFRPLDYVQNEEKLEALFDRAEAACRDAEETVQLRNIEYLRWGYTFVKLTSNHAANCEFGSEKIKTEWQAEAQALYNTMVDLDVVQNFQFMEGIAPVFWHPTMESLESWEKGTA